MRQPRPRRGAPRAALALAAVAVLAACGGSQAPPGYRQRTESFVVRVSSAPMPPFAREKTQFKVVVRDRESDQPIENGEGRIFAQNADGKREWDVLLPGQEVGTYYGNLSFLTAGEWAMGVQFRRDSTKQLERIDWMQQVLAERAGNP